MELIHTLQNDTIRGIVTILLRKQIVLGEGANE